MTSTATASHGIGDQLRLDVDAYIDDLIEHYPTRYQSLSATLRTVIARGRHERNELALPLLAHAAITHDPRPAVPVAAIHALWWRAANAFDDIADGDAGPHMYGIGPGPVLMAALECGHGLPLRAIAALDVPAPVREGLTADYLDGWSATNDGQIRDLTNTPTTVGPQDVLTTYEHKSGSSYAMACGMAARIAGCKDAVVTTWKQFGQVLGTLLQFRNDDEDLYDARDEDIRNGTATFRLVTALQQLPSPERQHALERLKRAATCDKSRAETKAMLLSSSVAQTTRAAQESLQQRAHHLLDQLATSPAATAALRTLIETAAAVPATRRP